MSFGGAMLFSLFMGGCCYVLGMLHGHGRERGKWRAAVGTGGLKFDSNYPRPKIEDLMQDGFK